ncbi:hypothetical protein EVAR_84125_1 [Eumeta japonica]|uniref:Uncharacterized protein n=1 Tax=Eumeta variegata TaxID=151549 RepID=A0A4C1UZM4_EUMVA|nr:hypothetical protein EVAR_84125_1 [Eumeta japonica]
MFKRHSSSISVRYRNREQDRDQGQERDGCRCRNDGVRRRARLGPRPPAGRGGRRARPSVRAARPRARLCAARDLCYVNDTHAPDDENAFSM